MTIRHTAFFFLCACAALSLAAFGREGVSQQDRTKAQTAVALPVSNGMQIQFAFGGNVAQVPAQIAASLALVPVRVNGSQPSWFLVDTARKTSAIDDVRAVAVGLYSPSAGGNRPASFSNVTLEFPGLKISLPSLALDSFGDFSARVGHTVDGALGADVLSRLVLNINYAGQSVQFYDPKAFQYKGRGTQIPVEFVAGIPSITGKVTVRHRGKFSGFFALATGQTEPVAFSVHFAGAHSFSTLTGKMLPFPGVDAASDTDYNNTLGHVQEIRFAKIAFEDTIGVFPMRSNAGAVSVPEQFICAIGGEILSRFTMILNSPARVLILEPNKTFPDIFTADMSGMTIIAIPPAFNKFEVAQVARKSPSAAAGIAVGDMIEKIDDLDASEYTLDDLRGLLRQNGVAHRLNLARNGKAFTVTLNLKPLV